MDGVPASSNPDAFSAGQLEEICRELGEAMSGSQLSRLLQQAGVRDCSAESTKWKRLYDALGAAQRRYGDGRGVIAMLHAAMDPARFGSDPDHWEAHREALNVTLAFSGLHLREDGRVARTSVARSLNEAHERANQLRQELRRRDVHPDVVKYCRAELLQHDYFHAVLEAAKSVADKIRDRTGVRGDAATLADKAFSFTRMPPPLAFNSLTTDWEESEHKGLATFAKALFQVFRNTTAHAPRLKWAVEQREALDMLTIASMLHRRLDEATVTPAAPAFLRHAA